MRQINRTKKSIIQLGQWYALQHEDAQMDLFQKRNRTRSYNNAEHLPVMEEQDYQDFFHTTEECVRNISYWYEHFGVDRYVVVTRHELLELAYNYGYRLVEGFHGIPDTIEPYLGRELYWLVKGKQALLIEDSFDRKRALRMHFAYIHDENFRILHHRPILWQQEFRISHQGMQMHHVLDAFAYILEHHTALHTQFLQVAKSWKIKMGMIEQLIHEIAMLRLQDNESQVAFLRGIIEHPAYPRMSPNAEEMVDFFYLLRRSIMSGFITGYDTLNKQLKWKRPVWADPMHGHIVSCDRKITEVVSSFV